MHSSPSVLRCSVTAERTTRMDSAPPLSSEPRRSHVVRGTERRRTREKLVRAGLAAVLESGWAATSVERVLTTVGVPKGSFYHYFASKDEFGYALLETYQAFTLNRLERCFERSAAAGTLTHQLAAFLFEASQSMRRYRWRRGCLVGVLGQELAGLHDGFRTRLHASVCQWESVLATAIRHAQHRGEVSASVDAERLSRSFWASWEGAVLRARLSRSAAPLVVAVEDFDRLIHS